jgi:hypothetical protein
MGFSKHKKTYALIGGSFLMGLMFIVITQITSATIDSTARNNQATYSNNYMAAANYIPLAPIPNFTDQGSNQKNISSTLNFLFRAGLIIAVLLSIIMTIVGGIEYMTMDAYTCTFCVDNIEHNQPENPYES